jgi:hypothetical protein
MLFRTAPVIFKIVPKAGYEFTLEKITNESKGKSEHNFNAAYGTICRISTVSVFKDEIFLIVCFSWV